MLRQLIRKSTGTESRSETSFQHTNSRDWFDFLLIRWGHRKQWRLQARLLRSRRSRMEYQSKDLGPKRRNNAYKATASTATHSWSKRDVLASQSATDGSAAAAKACGLRGKAPTKERASRWEQQLIFEQWGGFERCRHLWLRRGIEKGSPECDWFIVVLVQNRFQYGSKVMINL